ncbi:PfkB family carbohydrate kinase [Streptomyces sp. NPDC005866]|uniref:PfkB family carbohydrate kinase n=1 Tax=Streptomyces sp. NPDC005866 TaxID=3157075 RepID=UPI0033E09E93
MVRVAEAAPRSPWPSASPASAVPTRFAGRVGADPFGDRIRTTPAGAGVDIRFLESDPHRPTGRCMEGARPGGTTMRYYRQTSAATAYRRVPDEALDGVDQVHLSGITPALSDDCRDLVGVLLRRAPRSSFDVNHRVTPAVSPRGGGVAARHRPACRHSLRGRGRSLRPVGDGRPGRPPQAAAGALGTGRQGRCRPGSRLRGLGRVRRHGNRCGGRRAGRGRATLSPPDTWPPGASTGRPDAPCAEIACRPRPSCGCAAGPRRAVSGADPGRPSPATGAGPHADPGGTGQ